MLADTERETKAEGWYNGDELFLPGGIRSSFRTCWTPECSMEKAALSYPRRVFGILVLPVFRKASSTEHRPSPWMRRNDESRGESAKWKQNSRDESWHLPRRRERTEGLSRPISRLSSSQSRTCPSLGIGPEMSKRQSSDFSSLHPIVRTNTWTSRVRSDTIPPAA